MSSETPQQALPDYLLSLKPGERLAFDIDGWCAYSFDLFMKFHDDIPHFTHPAAAIEWLHKEMCDHE